jgi:hypothetical protein
MRRFLFRSLYLLSLSLLTLLAACSLPQVQAQERMFLDVSVEFLDEYILPKQEFEGTPVGGLSGIVSDRSADSSQNTHRFYAISDDRSQKAPARFYTLQVALNTDDPNAPSIDGVTVEGVTSIRDSEGQTYAPGTIDPEGIALSGDGSAWISTDGVTQSLIEASVGEYDRTTGTLKQHLPLPKYYIPDAADEAQTVGIQNNLGLESLTLDVNGSFRNGEPFRIFTATESALAQDRDVPAEATESSEAPTEAAPVKTRVLHYLVTAGMPQIIAEHLYLLDPAPPLSFSNGLVELHSLGTSGHFLALERTFTAGKYNAKLFQVAIADASDIFGSETLQGDVSQIKPIRKQLLLDLKDLNIPLYNLEGIADGPRLPDGSQSLLLVSDDNFRDEEKTQFLLFKLKMS